MKLSIFVTGFAFLLSVQAAPPPAEATPEVDPFAVPSDSLRVAHPERFWFSEYPDKPDDEAIWAFSNDLGTTPGYWIRFDGQTQFPPDGEHRNWTTIDDNNNTKDAAEHRRDMPAWVNGYTSGGCTPSQFATQVSQPHPGVCYGIWVQNLDIYSIYTSGVTTQINFYRGVGCTDFYTTARDWVGCYGTFVSPIRAVWLYG
ncbi:hypothetical protein AJ80_09804 [Polytolypa hystricis UAMH7299]|uniref:Ecp2 effector protein domain-containing protein n=1 Tax=Polytolypa hystricis (strain UAMH7299) TaxID=1447883 RepID=A0A2B7WIQ4_POLH7|nr:hypothetical protein AJ80_09804 [Polytolypa hystricis UAMH7299]